MAEKQLDPVQAEVVSAEGGRAVASKKSVVFFRDFGAEKVEYRMAQGHQSLHILTGLPGNQEVVVDLGTEEMTQQTTSKGMLVFEVPAGLSTERVQIDVWG